MQARGGWQVLAGLVVPACAGAAVLDFETPGQLTGNFRMLSNAGTSGNTGLYQLAQSANGTANDYLTAYYASTGGGAASFVYDTTPAESAVKTTFNVPVGSTLTVTMGAVFHKPGSSLGVYFINPANEGAGYLALFNADASGSNDNFRFANGAAPNTAGAGALSANNYQATSVAVLGAADYSTFSNVTATYSVLTSNSYRMTLRAGSTLVSSATYTGTPLTNVGVGLRVYSEQAYLAVDNFSAAVPEPAAVSVLGIAGLAALRRKRDRR